MKRVLLGTIAVLTAAVLPFSGAFAKDNPLDYANSIGQLDEADTTNLVVETTSDGGYVVGGRAISCIKRSVGDNSMQGTGDDYEVIPTEECFEFSVAGFEYDSKKPLAPFMIDMCEMFGRKGYQSPYRKDLVCKSYIAKFKKDGTREWLTAIDDDNRPVAVGEIASGYRLLVDGGIVYTVSKNGEYLGSMELYDEPTAIDAGKFDKDGSLFVVDYSGISKYNQSGELIAQLPADDDSATTWEEFYIGDKLMRHRLAMNGDIYMDYCTGSTDSDDGLCGIAKISKDLKTVTPIVVDDFEKGEVSSVVSSDSNGNILVISVVYDTEVDEDGDIVYSNPHDSKLVVYDKDGNKLSEMNMDEDMFNGFFGGPIPIDVMPGFVLYSPAVNRIIKLNTNLEPAIDFELNDGEVANNSAILDDGSIVLVGDSTSSTDHYDVEGARNGIQIRLDAKGGEPEPTGDGTVNPSTLDNIQIIVAISGTALLLGGVASRKFIVRR